MACRLLPEKSETWIREVRVMKMGRGGRHGRKMKIAATYYAKIDPNTLTIKKTGSEVNENDTFLFKVTGNGVDLTVSIKGTGSAVIEFIPNGTYTVEEVSKWSWEYNAASSQTVTVTDSGTVTFTNTKDTTKRWLSGESSINNKFSAFLY